MKVAIFDYGIGNLHSLAKGLQACGAQVRIETDVNRALREDALVLPGVGAFAPAAAALYSSGPALRAALAEGHPCLGICLGMQLLFESSEEGIGPGLGALNGVVRRLNARRVPHMGWNAVHPACADPLFADLGELKAYYANSFVVQPADAGAIIAWTEYEGHIFPAAIRQGRTWGVQFHPEKSGAAGVRLIANFLAQARS
jgi:imidazole glycerol-phosphate synthase subunit HisH